jgi:spore germination cell wall hydrolase CwlJ-like protein
MKASRRRPKGAFRRPFGLVLCVVTAMPNSVGHQDLAALIARQPAVTERWRAHVRNSALGTVHAASLSFPRLVGTAIPDPYFTQLAALDPRALEATGSIPLNVPIDPMVTAPVYDFPVVDRRLKGDRLDVKSAPPAQAEPPRPQPRAPSKTKDMVSRPPVSESPRMTQSLAPEVRPTNSRPALSKTDRLAPSQVKTGDGTARIYRRAGLAAGQDTMARRALGTAPRKPVEIAAPAASVADKVPRRAGLAARQKTLAKRMLGLGPRKPAMIATRPVEPAPAPVAAVEAGVQVAAAPEKPFRPAGLAAAYLNRIKSEAKWLAAVAARTPPAETADLESQRADLRGPVVPPRARLAETADLESQRADLMGPIVPAPASVVEVPAPPAPVFAELPFTPEWRLAEPQVAVADIPSEPDAPVAQMPPERRALPAAAAPAVADVVPSAPGKNIGRFNPEAAEKLASFAKPSAQTSVFFGRRELGVGRNSWEAWEPGEVPTVLAPAHVDTEIKRAALDAVPNAETEKGGETIAPKGEVTGEGKRPRTPAERLNLSGAARVKHARCLANAIYFEARGEVERGQMAVAQVVLNRVFTGHYPGSVCDVVYQNAHRHLACQFTFACDNHKDVVRDQKAWEVATRIADDALDGKFWLPEVGKATHYHATYVNPWWVRTMTKHTKLGIHIFYRPKRWGDGEEIPVWGDRLDLTGSIKREASPATPAKKNDDKRADAQPAAPPRRSIFDPVEPISLPGG